jgi:2-hydroxychromene-2-carboxylate isomerase
MWSDPKKMDDPRVIESALEESGLPAVELLALAVDPSVKQELIDNTERSVARGTFGSPSFYVGDELFFGKDRLREVEEEIEAQKEVRR